MIRQGEVYWVDFGPPRGSGPASRRPAVVIQNNIANGMAIATTIVCIISTNLRLAQAAGNVLLAKGEGGLHEDSVVNVSQIITVDKAELEDSIGAVRPERVSEILDGVWSFLRPTSPRAR